MSRRKQEQELTTAAMIELQDRASTAESGVGGARLVQAGPAPRRQASVASTSSRAFFQAPPFIKMMLLGPSEYKKQAMSILGSSSEHMSTLGMSRIEREYANTKFQIWDTAHLTMRVTPNQLRNIQALLFIPDTADTLESLYQQSEEASLPMFWMEMDSLTGGESQTEALNAVATRLLGLVKLNGTVPEKLLSCIQEEVAKKQVTSDGMRSGPR